MANARKLPSGNWRCQVYSHTDEKGTRKYRSFTASTKAEAQRQAAEYAAHKNRYSRGDGITIGEAIDRYIEDKSHVLSPSTIRGYRSIQQNHYKDIAHKKVDSISSSDLQRYVNALSATTPSKTVHNVYGLLIASIGQFSDATYHVKLPPKEIIERNIPTDEDVKNLISLAKGDLKLCIVLASVGTLRLGEICGLTYKDVRRANNTIYVHSDRVRGVDGYVYKEIPKTSSSERVVPFPKEVIDMIPDGNPDDHIITILPVSVDKAFKRLRNSLGLKCRFHDLRHYAASIMHAIGVPDVYIMERGGWKSDTILKSVYRNSLNDKANQFSDQINQYLSNTILS